MIYSAMGSPIPEVFWMKNNAIRLPEFDSKDGYSILQLRAIDNKIAGLYSCIARNSIGETHSTAQVDFNSSVEDLNENLLSMERSIEQNIPQQNPVKALTILNCASTDFEGNLHVENRHVVWNTVIVDKSTELDLTIHAMNNGSLVLPYFATVTNLKFL